MVPPFSCFDLQLKTKNYPQYRSPRAQRTLVVNSPCAAAIPAPGALLNSAARPPTLPGTSALPAHTFLSPDTHAPDCSEENAAARSAALRGPAPARELLHRPAPTQQGTRQCRLTS